MLITQQPNIPQRPSVLKTHSSIFSITSYKDHCCSLFKSRVIKNQNLYFDDIEKTPNFGSMVYSLEIEKYYFAFLASLWQDLSGTYFNFTYASLLSAQGPPKNIFLFRNRRLKNVVYSEEHQYALDSIELVASVSLSLR